ncbi:aminoacyl peptidase [bacterium SM23_57]|nr:MAG: aminoacyl peptidase [bacterium SM23_57]
MSVFAQDTETIAQKYMEPPKAIADLADAPQTPWVSISPDNEWMVVLNRPGYPSIEEVAQPELRLAGVRINPRTNGPSRARYADGMSLIRIKDGREYPVSNLPDNPKIDDWDWSPDGKWLSFTITTKNRVELWALDMKKSSVFRISELPLNAAYGRAYDWVSDSRTILVKTVPTDRGEPPEEPVVPEGPVVQENLGRKAPARTYQDLLENPYDEAMFTYYTTSQLVKLDLDGRHSLIGDPGIIERVVVSPDGKFILVESVHRPFSYTLPEDRFPRKIEVWDMEGNVVYEVADVPLADQIPITYSSVRTGRRSVRWRPDADATLYWGEALDGGDAGAEAEWRDQVYMLPAPFDSDPIPLIKLKLRYSYTMWANNGLAVVNASWWKTRQTKSWWVKPGSPDLEPALLIDRSWEDRYNDPGFPMFKRTDRGTWVMITANDGKTLFLSGEGASPEGDRPFVDEFDVTTHETVRLFRSEAPYYEEPYSMIDVGKRTVITRRESIDEQPNFFTRDLKKGDLTQVTYFPHPTPQLIGVQKEMIRYQREDGLDLTATLYLPPGYTTDDGPLPMLMWAYPQEYKDADAAGQVTDSPYRFIRVGWYSPMLWLVHGYAVLDDPTMPIVGEGDEEPNDTFVKQLVSSAQAAVDEVVRRGVADRDRIAIGGHSYGAFMTANLLAHSDLFRAGLARTGAYNRTLTPFGFQSEERTLWEAPDVYFTMSPFMHADKINEPILMVHGDSDSNAGTFPLQSERLYGAIKGLGGTARLVMLPHESHSYRARENVMHVLWETTEWLDKYVKNAPPRDQVETTGTSTNN